MMMLKSNMPSIEGREGAAVPAGLPPVIDAHVHVFPPNIFSAIWKWFDKNAWRIRYQLTSSEIFDFLLSHGIKHIVALQYAHKPGIATGLNAYMAETCKAYRNHVTGMATVFPGEKNAEKQLQKAFDLGLGGLKLHAHVQCFDMNADYMYRLYECCQRNGKPIVMHVSREPKSDAYSCDPYVLCAAEKVEPVLKDFPNLRICVPHLGFDEIWAYKNLIEKYENLWLDTTMVITDYFQLKERVGLAHYRSDRIMYGSDFPNIPYSWDKELNELKELQLPEEALENISYKTAADFFGLKRRIV
jgi:predicted TIM-barrel fold metal-dependent hydrolase